MITFKTLDSLTKIWMLINIEIMQVICSKMQLPVLELCCHLAKVTAP